MRSHYEVHEWRHAIAILRDDFPREWQDIIEILTGFRLLKSHITVGGGSKSKVAEALDSAFYGRGWVEKAFDTKVVIDQTEIESPTHKVDCYKNQVGLEVEWNNKDPFFDRDEGVSKLWTAREDGTREQITSARTSHPTPCSSVWKRP